MNSLFEKSIVFTATGAYSGLLPVAPGTFGTLVGIGIFYGISAFSPYTYVLLLLPLFFLSVYVSSKAELIFREKDSKRIVIDEIFGFLVTMAFIPNRLLYIVLGFFFFRLFDIFKIFPGNLIDKRVKNGYGVVLDDVFAGLYANLLLQAFRLLKF